MTTYADRAVEHMTIAQLRARLIDLGLDVPANAKKTDLVQMYLAAGGPGAVITPDIPEAEVIDEHLIPAVAGADLVVREPTSALVRPAGTTRDIATAFKDYANLCNEVLDEDDYQSIGGKRYRTKSAWRKLAVAYGVNIELDDELTERTPEGALLRVHCTVRATAPNGRFADGLGSCDATERKFSHLEHDVRATAYTRAANRACADLFGLGEVSAEEVQGEVRGVAPMPTPEQVKQLVETAKAAKAEGIDVGGPWPKVFDVRILTDTEPREPVAPESVVVALTMALQYLRNTMGFGSSGDEHPATQSSDEAKCAVVECELPAVTDDGYCADHEPI